MLGLVVGLVGATAAAEPPAPTIHLLEQGKAVYDQACAACHGATGEGNGPVAFAIKPPPRNFRKDPFKAGDSVEQVFKTITSGLADTRMVGYPQLKELDRWGIAYFVVSLRPAKK